MERKDYLEKIQASIQNFPITALLGPRQVGKTTLAKDFAEHFQTTFSEIHRFDLENPVHHAQLENPQLTLSPLKGLVIIDEVQLAPKLFPLLRVLADRRPLPARFLVLGSASNELVQYTSESLAGRIAFVDVFPFGLYENLALKLEILWLRGGFPQSTLAESDEASYVWREQFIRTFLERDIPQLGFRIPAMAMRRFWMMLAHYHGQTLNFSEIARSLDISDASCKRYLDILTGTFLVRRLQPWFTNTLKRQVKAPKIYMCDSGIFHALMGISNKETLNMHPKLGASWEGFALEEILKVTATRPEEAFYWGIHQQGELDLLLFHKGKKYGFEFKYSDAPKVTKSMQLAIENLDLAQLTIIYPGEEKWQISDKIRVCGLKRLIENIF